MKLLLTTLFFLLTFYLSAQQDVVGARSSALGGCSVTQSDVFSAYNNQAGLAFVKKNSFGAYFENRFLVKQLIHSSFLAVIPLQKGSFGFTYSGFGYSQFKQDRFGISYGILLGENFSVGAQLNYHSIRLGDIYGKTNALTAAIGFQGKLSKQVIVAAHVYNPNRTKLTDYNNERLPSSIKLGIQYIYTEKLNLQFEADKGIYNRLNFKGGIEYMPANDFYLRLGTCSAPSTFCFGTGFKLNAFKMDISSSYHPVFGFSPQVAIHTEFGKKTKEQKTESEK